MARTRRHAQSLSPAQFVDLARERLHYDSLTGAFRWVAGRRKGTVAGTVNSSGYVQISVCDCVVLAHRLAWAWVHGEWPEILDHANGDRSDNRIANLRECTRQQSVRNRKGWGRTPYKGVYERRGRWRAYINIDGRRKELGGYESPEAAAAAYDQAARTHFGSFARPNFVSGDHDLNVASAASGGD